MMMFCRIALDGAPRGKGRGRAVATPAGARVYTDAKTRTYEAQLRFAGQQAMGGRAASAAAIRVVMTVFFPVRGTWSKKKRALARSGRLWPTVRPDADNSLKLCDGLNGVVWLDDKQIVNASVMKCYSERPGLLIEVWELGHTAVAEKPLALGEETMLALI